MSKVIVYQSENGGVALVIPAPACGLTVEQIAKKDVPKGAPYQIFSADQLPKDYTFRHAWRLGGGSVSVDFEHAQRIAQEKRRGMRSAELAPFDEIVARQIPGETEKAEAERARIRKKYADLQKKLDAAKTVGDLSALLRPI